MNEIVEKAFDLADESLLINDFPVGAVVFNEDYEIIGVGYNKRNTSNITIHHAEIIAIIEANKKENNWNLTNKCMVTTLEPCDMCKEVIKQARISKVYYLVPRFKNKKPYKHTVFEKLDARTELSKKYLENITNFFKDKR